MDKKMMILPVLAIVLSVLGATYAYFSGSVTGNNPVNATSYKFDVTLAVNLVNPSTEPTKGYGLIPIDETDLGTAISRNCTDKNGYAVCRIFELTFTNNSGEAVTLNGTLTPSSNNFANLKYSVTQIGAAKTALTAGNPLPNAPVTNGFQNLTIPTGTSKMYVMLYVNNLNANQPNDQGKTFSGTLTLVDATGGNQLYAQFGPNYVYTGSKGNNATIGQPISVTTYQSPETAMAALKAAGGGTTNYPFFLAHTVGDGTVWCANEYESGVATGSSSCIFENQTDCNSAATSWTEDDYTYSCVQNTFTNGVTESYVGFVVTDTMAQANSGMTAGTYYLKGGNNGVAYNTNKTTLTTAFGSSNCTDYSSYFNCYVPGLRASAYDEGRVVARADDRSYCRVDADGSSDCGVYGGSNS